MLKKDTIRGKNSFQSRESYKWKPFLDLTTKAGQKQLINLLKPLTQKQAAALKEVKSKMEDLEKSQDVICAKLAEQAIDNAKNLGVSMKRYEKKFSSLEINAYLNNMIDLFLRSRREPHVEIHSFSLQRTVKKVFSLDSTNEQINEMLITLIEERIEKNKQFFSWTEDNSGRIKKYYSLENSFLEATLNDLKANPVDFTKFLDPQAWNKE